MCGACALISMGGLRGAEKTVPSVSPSPVVAIVGGKVFPVSGPVIEGGTVVIRNGKIESVGKGVAVPADAKRIDATGQWVLPGMIDSRTHLGLWEVDLDPVTRDEDEDTDAVRPQMRVVNAFAPSPRCMATISPFMSTTVQVSGTLILR